MAKEDSKSSHQLYCCILNPHDQLGRLCVYGIYKRSLRAPTKEKAWVMIAVDIRGKNTPEQDQIRIWAAPTAGPEISTVLEGILGTWGGLCLPARERTLTAVTQERHLLFLCFNSFYRFIWIFFFFLFPPLCYSCRFYWHSLWNPVKLLNVFFPQSHFYCCYKLCLYIGFCSSIEFSLFSSFLFFNLKFFKPIIIFFYIYSFVCFSYSCFPLAVNL